MGRWARLVHRWSRLCLSPGRRAAGNSTTKEPTNRLASIIFRGVEINSKEERQIDGWVPLGTGISAIRVGPDYSPYHNSSGFNSNFCMVIDSLNDIRLKIRKMCIFKKSSRPHH